MKMNEIKRTQEIKVEDLIELLKQYKKNDIVQLWCDGGVDSDGLEYAEALLAVYNPRVKICKWRGDLMRCEIYEE